MKTTKMPPSGCPTCLKKIDEASSMSDDPTPPKPGDFSICLSCCTTLVFDENLLPRRALTEDLTSLPIETLAQLWRMKAAAILSRRQREQAKH